jgi:hypothetical protein
MLLLSIFNERQLLLHHAIKTCKTLHHSFLLEGTILDDVKKWFLARGNSNGVVDKQGNAGVQSWILVAPQVLQ